MTPAHFTPDRGETEIGFLGAGPPLDTIAGIRYPIHVNVHRQDSTLTIEWGSASRNLPSARTYMAAMAASNAS